MYRFVIFTYTGKLSIVFLLLGAHFQEVSEFFVSKKLFDGGLQTKSPVPRADSTGDIDSIGALVRPA